MRNFLFVMAGVSAALAIYIASQHGEGAVAAKRLAKGDASPVGELAHQLQGAWADHHTSA